MIPPIFWSFSSGADTGLLLCRRWMIPARPSMHTPIPARTRPACSRKRGHTTMTPRAMSAGGTRIAARPTMSESR
jgi:hypothetical protein